jgi:hypothetical protein
MLPPPARANTLHDVYITACTLRRSLLPLRELAAASTCLLAGLTGWSHTMTTAYAITMPAVALLLLSLSLTQAPATTAAAVMNMMSMVNLPPHGNSQSLPILSRDKWP